MKMFVNEDCIGCGLCESICPEVFSLNDDGVAQAINTDIPEDDTDSALEAMEGCPVEAIRQA